MNFEQARFNMVEQQIRPWEVLDQDVLNLLMTVKREEFVPAAYRELAFTEVEIPIGCGQVMLKPVIEGKVLQALRLGKSDSVLEVGDLRLDEDSYEVSRAGAAIELTATEFELLRFLMRNPRRVLSKAQILDRVWNYDFGGQANVVELYISYLRKKIDAGRSPMIHTLRGVGYVLRPAVD